ncbi:MAG TPA: diguanylate cyclase [Accumulibacter sp.]|nr:diguanylate cyclase [Accumulibacter sp.]HMW18548.1 diguanylate cyclase [Accumulibacter sp.]HMX23859.1 diguanylate cyclase [Accumulibacter sp.]HMY07391.1 diguanylate cyclase [Accumulibacter sp.]HNC18714.1 diguanylate cyclase [Accumulibacter sp.]
MELSLLDALQLGVILLDREGVVLFWNRWFTEHLLEPDKPPAGRTLAEMFPELTNRRLETVVKQALRANLSSILTPGLSRSPLPLYHLSVENTREHMQQLIHITPLENPPVACMLQIQDMTAVRRRERRLRVQSNQWLDAAYLDALTAVGNRRRFDHALADLYQKAEKTATSLGVIMLDVDFFKIFNDAYGHQKGDDCLCQVAQTLQQSLRKQTGDLICRYGGEEFAILLPGADEYTACAIAERLRVRVYSLKLPYGGPLADQSLSISLGVAVANPSAGQTPETLVDAADRALYHAKADGRNRCMYFDCLSQQVLTCLEPRADIGGG